MNFHVSPWKNYTTEKFIDCSCSRSRSRHLSTKNNYFMTYIGFSSLKRCNFENRRLHSVFIPFAECRFISRWRSISRPRTETLTTQPRYITSVCINPTSTPPPCSPLAKSYKITTGMLLTHKEFPWKLWLGTPSPVIIRDYAGGKKWIVISKSRRIRFLEVKVD